MDEDCALIVDVVALKLDVDTVIFWFFALESFTYTLPLSDFLIFDLLIMQL